jgi:hypothetical protein
MQITSSIECTLLLVGTQYLCVLFVHVLLVKRCYFSWAKNNQVSKRMFSESKSSLVISPQ